MQDIQAEVANQRAQITLFTGLVHVDILMQDIRAEVANQRARKTLFTGLVDTNTELSMSGIK